MIGDTRHTGFDARGARTYPGMAHWGGSGPNEKTCRECVHFLSPGYFEASNARTPNRLKDGRCGKYKAMMSEEGAAFPPDASACRFFSENPSAPPLRASR